jgi:alpha-D-ribose 1-methylphosphonate 5-triphosphate diphosphatase
MNAAARAAPEQPEQSPMSTIITNARLILEEEVVSGHLAFEGDTIHAVDAGAARAVGALDAEGDFLAPGLIEMHTDNLEKHFVPRPGVIWPNGIAAALVHDAQMASAGVTTVYDAICAGYDYGPNDTRNIIFPRIFEALAAGKEQDVFRIDHRIHLRCELTGASLMGTIAPYVDHPLVLLASLMDHTPGQRQYRDISKQKAYIMGTSNKSEAEVDAHLEERMRRDRGMVARNWTTVVDTFSARGIPIATHDDTTVEHVEQGLAAGAVISEFPTTVEAAEAARARGLATVAGAPNVVRGGSHSGGVSVSELAERGALDGLSSDYVPASLLQAVHQLNQKSGMTLPSAMAMVTWNIADMLGLEDRGRLRPGLRADLVQFRFVAWTPVVRGLWCGGRRVL